MDIQIIMRQRKQNIAHKSRDDWRSDQSRLSTILYLPLDLSVKAGADATTSAQLLETLRPSFDPNKNDIWSKRLNTLRRFIGLVSRWLVRKRLSNRFERIKKTLRDAGVETKEQAKAFIASENENYKASGNTADNSKLLKEAAANGSSSSSSSGVHGDGRPTTLATLVCSLPSKALAAKTTTAIVNSTKKYEVTPNMARRVLFPKFTADDVSVRAQVDTVDISRDSNFDDRSYFPVIIKYRHRIKVSTSHYIINL
jgi:hypothetical protein